MALPPATEREVLRLIRRNLPDPVASSSSTAGAPTTAQYIVAVDDPGLSADKVLTGSPASQVIIASGTATIGPGAHLVSVSFTTAAGVGWCMPRYLEVAAGIELELGADSDVEVT